MHPPSTSFGRACRSNFGCSLRRFSTSPSTYSASSSKNPFPFPSHSRPTPHQIFHLPHGATQADIKARYYDLVRIHHPDSALCRSVPPDVRHSQFQAITSAYDALRGKKAHSTVDPYAEEVKRRRRAYHSHYGHRPRAEYAYQGSYGYGYGYGGRHDWHASADDRWKDRLILVVGVTTLIVGLAPGLFLFPAGLDQRHRAAVASLAQARSEARETGGERMRLLRMRAKEIRKENTLAQEAANKTIDEKTNV